MSTLHILNKAPGHPRFTLCQAQLAEGDSLVLLEDAVLGYDQPELIHPGVGLLVLRADADARGLLAFAARPTINLVDHLCDMDQVVELAVAHTRVVNW